MQRARLNWLEEHPGVGSTTEFQGKALAAAFGVPFTAAEIEQATDFLRENELIHGFQSLGGFQGPAINYEGGYALHYDGLIAEFLKRGGSTTYDYSTSNTMGDNNIVGAQQGGHSNTANRSQNVITVDQRARVLAGSVACSAPSTTPTPGN